MEDNKLTFSRSVISRIKPPTAGRVYYKDTASRNLIIDVSAKGTVTFQVYRKSHGRPVRVTLGRFSATLPESRDIAAGVDPLSLLGNAASVNVKIARKLADAVNASLDKGVNPGKQSKATRRASQDEFTLEKAFDAYFTEHLLPHGKKTAIDLQNDFNRYLGKVAPGQKKLRGIEKKKSPGSVDWCSRKLSTISATDVRKLLISLKENIGARTANKVFVLLRSIYNFVIKWGTYQGPNPCSGIEKFKERSRDRFVDGAELPRFMSALQRTQDWNFQDFILLSLYTGARRANVLAMRWQDINLDTGVWAIPGEVLKNDAPLAISLAQLAKAILERRKRDATVDAVFVFEAKSASGYMSPPNKKWKALLIDAGIENLRLHDLRRSLGSWAAMSGASLPIIGKMLGHKSPDATAVYARLSIDPVAEAVETAINAMQNHLSGT